MDFRYSTEQDDFCASLRGFLRDHAGGARIREVAAADGYGLPVSTTHVLSSGVAGTMAANGSGLQMATVRNLLMAWVLTLPAAITLSATLYILFLNIF